MGNTDGYEVIFQADNHAFTCIVALVNSFSLVSFMDIAMYVAGTSYSGLQGILGASYCYSSGVIGILHCIIAVLCIFTLLRAIFLIKTDKLNKKNQ